MLVRDLAMRVGVSPDTVRYYVRIGLLRPVRDQHNGYRLFTDRDIDRLRYIREAKALGLTLREIRCLAAAGHIDARGMTALLERRLVDTRRRISELTALSRRICAVLTCSNAEAARSPVGSAPPNSARFASQEVEACTTTVPRAGRCPCVNWADDGQEGATSVVV